MYPNRLPDKMGLKWSENEKRWIYFKFQFNTKEIGSNLLVDRLQSFRGEIKKKFQIRKLRLRSLI